jgi:hypothetical protein
MSQPTARAEGRGPLEPRAAERRATVRYPSTLLTSLKPLGGGKNASWEAEIRDVSAGGLGLIVRRRFERGTLLAIEPAGPGAEAPALLLAQVVHATSQPHGRWLVGCKLVRELSEAEVRALR